MKPELKWLVVCMALALSPAVLVGQERSTREAVRAFDPQGLHDHDHLEKGPSTQAGPAAQLCSAARRTTTAPQPASSGDTMRVKSISEHA